MLKKLVEECKFLASNSDAPFVQMHTIELHTIWCKKLVQDCNILCFTYVTVKNTRQLYSTTAQSLLQVTSDMQLTLAFDRTTLSNPRQCLETVNIKHTLFAC